MKRNVGRFILNLVALAIDAVMTVFLCGLLGDLGLIISVAFALTLYKFVNGL